jgi:hypothetical protein
MDLQRAHVEAGLIHRRGKRKFSAISEEDPTSSTTIDPPTAGEPENGEEDADEHEENICDFEELTAELISAAEADDMDDDDSDDLAAPSEVPSAVPSGLTIRILP